MSPRYPSRTKPVWPLLVLLDRDGVINADSPDYILSVDQWQPLPGSIEAIACLSRAGIAVAVCTNQSAIGRGLLSEATLEAIHAQLKEQVIAAGGELTAIYACPHSPEAQCGCRKPAPGLCQKALLDRHVLASDALLIGDSERDLAAAQAIGMPAWLVRTGNGRQTEAGQAPNQPVYDDLADAVKAVLALSQRDT